MAASLRGPSLLDFALAAVVFVLTAAPYLNSLRGNFCYDDKVAVGGNPDVVLPNVTLWDIATHDFWGNDILRRRPGGWTHDSWRPIVTLSFRANHKIGGLDTFVYHVTNVIIHSSVAVMAYALAWTLLRPPMRASGTAVDANSARRRSLQAAAAALLFGLHPVHSECVANITSRADPMAAFFCFAAAIVYVWGRSSDGFFEPCASALTAGAVRAQLLSDATSSVVKDRGDFDLSPVSRRSSSLSRRHRRDNKRECGCTTACSKVCSVFGAGARLSGQWLLSIFLVLLGIACKETSLVMPLVLVLLDLGIALPAVVRLVWLTEALDSQLVREDTAPPAAMGVCARSSYAARFFWRWLVAGVSAAPLVRSTATLIAGGAIYYLRIIKMSKGYSLQSFANEMHNPLANIKDAFVRRMGKAFVQSWAMTKLIVPIWLSHEHNAHQPVMTVTDPRNLLTLFVTLVLSSLLVWAFGTLVLFSMRPSTAAAAMQSTKSIGGRGHGGAKISGEAESLNLDFPRESAQAPASSGSRTPASNVHLGADFPAVRDVSGRNRRAGRLSGGGGLRSSAQVTWGDRVSHSGRQHRGLGGDIGEESSELSAESPISGRSSSDNDDNDDDGGISLGSSEEEDEPREKVRQYAVAGRAGFPSTEAALSAARAGGVMTTPRSSPSRPTPTVHSRSGKRLSSPSAGSGASAAAMLARGGAGNGGVHNALLADAEFVASENAALKWLDVATRVLVGLGWVIATYAPSSHAFLYVAFVLAERTLFVPSFGAALLVSEALTLLATVDFRFCAASSDVKPSHRRAAAGATLATLLLYYSVRIFLRNPDWSTEEALLRSNLAIYPEHNGMTQYGMGAIKLYQQKYDEAETLLKRALNETTLAEPHILLSQLYWKTRNNYDAAIEQLAAIEHTTSPRREVMQNLGLLLMATGRAPTTNHTARVRAEYLILLGHAAHGYPMGHPNIGLLSSNAACVRLLSEKERFAAPQLVDGLFTEALKFRHSSRVTALRNFALVEAAQGRRGHAAEIAREAIAYIEELRDRADQPPEGKKQAGELIKEFQILILSLDVHAPIIEAWGEGDAGIGRVAEDRLALIGGQCAMELLYW